MSKIKILVMDVDGTLTDGKIYMGADGESVKAFSIKDGYGIHDMLIPAGICPVIITGRKSKILECRCEELGIVDVYQNIKDKVSILNNIAIQKNISLSEFAYIGDDLNDLPCMLKLLNENGVVGCPADASEDVKNISTFISQKNGGCGAVREFIEFILKTV